MTTSHEQTNDQLFIAGEFRTAGGDDVVTVLDPATEEPVGTVRAASSADVADAVAAAEAARQQLRVLDRSARIALLASLLAAYDERADDLVDAVAAEIGLPVDYARDVQVATGRIHLERTAAALADFAFERAAGGSRVVMAPIGIAAQITPWNWPLTQIVLKVAPALATGCASVLKPSEFTPRQSAIFAEIVAASDLPAGAFGMVTGPGPTVGAALVDDPRVGLVTFTGSTRAGKEVAAKAAAMVKRVALELGGKSAAILLDDADVATAVPAMIDGCFDNNGQSCDAPTRLLVPRAMMDAAVEAAVAAAERHVVGDPRTDDGVTLGPVINQRQFGHVNRLIDTAIAEGSTVATGGPGRPDGRERGYFIRPTVFADVAADSTIAVEEVFGPVTAIVGYDTVDEAVEIANSSDYGLAGYVHGVDHERAVAVAERLDVGQVQINCPEWEADAPFGGRKQSGYGREGGAWGLDDYVEPIALLGDRPRA
ncbi:MAG: aldehyde dehydrogenase family protein [Actinomycetota bacterium]